MKLIICRARLYQKRFTTKRCRISKPFTNCSRSRANSLSDERLKIVLKIDCSNLIFSRKKRRKCPILHNRNYNFSDAFEKGIILNESQSAFNWPIYGTLKIFIKRFISNYYKYFEQYISRVSSFHFAKNYEYRAEDKHLHRNAKHRTSQRSCALFSSCRASSHDRDKEGEESRYFFSLGGDSNRSSWICATTVFNERRTGSRWLVTTLRRLLVAIKRT